MVRRRFFFFLNDCVEKQRNEQERAMVDVVRQRANILSGRFRNRIIYPRDGAILGRSIVKFEASLMDLKASRSSDGLWGARTVLDKTLKLMANNGAKSRPNRA